jgi:neutral ceramidase
MDSTFKLGFGTSALTPPVGTPLAGYPDIRTDLPWTPAGIRGYVGRRKQVSEGVHDPLLATACAIEFDGVAAVVVGIDTLVVTREFTRALRDALAARSVPPENILVGASHTHSGPDLFAWWEGDLTAAPWPATLAAAVTAAEQALDRLEPAELSFGEASLGHASVNRRDEANGRIDPRVSVLRATALGTDEVLGLVVGFACHPVTLDYSNFLFSADWIAPLRATLAAVYPGATTVYLNGAAGNINPARFPYETRQNIYVPQTEENYPVYWGGFTDARRLGRTVAGAAVEAAERALPLAPAAPAGRVGPARLPLKEQQAMTEYLDFMNFTHEGYRQAMLAGSELESEAQLLSIGDARIVGVPGEVFVEIGLEIREAAGPGPLLLAGYANDDVRYVMTDDAYQGDKYETVGTPLAAGSARALADAVRAILFT